MRGCGGCLGSMHHSWAEVHRAGAWDLRDVGARGDGKGQQVEGKLCCGRGPTERVVGLGTGARNGAGQVGRAAARRRGHRRRQRGRRRVEGAGSQEVVLPPCRHVRMCPGSREGARQRRGMGGHCERGGRGRCCAGRLRLGILRVVAGEGECLPAKGLQRRSLGQAQQHARGSEKDEGDRNGGEKARKKHGRAAAEPF